MIARATLGDVPLDGYANISWTSRPGVTPDQATWLLAVDTARAIWELRGSPVSLVYDVGRGPVTVHGLYVLSLEPGDSPYTLRVRVADRRWMWSRSWVARDYNLRRKTGDQRILNNTMQLANAFLTDTVSYAPHSLIDGSRAWTALEVIDDILGDALGEDYSVTVKRPIELRVEDLPLDTDGASALARAIQFTPGLGIKLNESDGLPMLYDVADQSEEAVAASVGPVDVGRGYPGTSDRRAERPRRVRVLFTPEIEVRFDVDHEAITPHFGGNSQLEVTRELVPVIAIPDPSFDTANYGVLNAGSWMPLHEWLDDLQRPANGGLLANGRHSDIPLSDARIRKHLIAPGHPMERLDVLYAVDKFGNRDAVWSNRIGQLRGAYRQIYQIHRSMLDRFRTWHVQRVAVLDDANQIRGTTQVWTDWVRRPSWRGVEERGQGNLAAPWYVAGYAERLEDGQGAPASVSVMERDTGTLRIVPQVSQWENSEMVFFGRFVDDTMPAYSAAIAHRWHHQELSAEHKKAIIVTAIPAGKEQLYAVEVTPSEVSQLVGYDVGQGQGPTLDVRIGGGLQTARFAWLDDNAPDWDAWWGGFRSGTLPEGALINGEILAGIAKAAAAQVYDAFVDIPSNAYTVGLTGQATITGAVKQIRHTLSRDGSATTQIRTSPSVLERDPWQRMPDSVRRVLERLVVTE